MKELQVEKKRRSDDDEEDWLRLKKRWKEEENGAPDMAFVVDQLSRRKPGGGIPTAAFLCASRLHLHVVDRIGPTMAVLREDVRRNIERVECAYAADPSTNSCLSGMIKKEMDAATARSAESCSRALLWLARSMDFAVALVAGLEGDAEASLEHLVEAAYEATLKPWHGWISTAAYRVALKMIPHRRKLVEMVLGEGETGDSFEGGIRDLVALLRPLLDEIHALLGESRLDRMKSA
ncbi:glycolipid transfer protein 3-like isoform X2 [Wolffia australiana]